VIQFADAINHVNIQTYPNNAMHQSNRLIDVLIRQHRTQMRPNKTLNECYRFSSTEGHHLVWKILVDTLPFEPYDDQITGVCKTLDGIDILIISAMGSGKMGYFFMVLIVIIIINKNPELCPSAKLKEDLTMIVLCPTNALKVDMVCFVILRIDDKLIHLTEE